MNTTPAFQIKLSFDEGLQQTWNILKRRYVALDKASIVRLALNNLVNEVDELSKVKKLTPEKEQELWQYMERLEKSKVGMTEKQFARWWNKNKSSL